MIRYLIRVTKPFRYTLNEYIFSIKGDQQQLLALKDKYKNKPMLVIGNGPSLNSTPLSEFAGIPSIGMNKIDLFFKKTSWRPDLIVCVNNVVVRQHRDAFIKSDIPIFLSWKNRLQIQSKNRGKVNFFLTLLSNDFSRDISKGLGSSVTVTYSALQFAYYMGANPIILFGVDHSFAFSGKESEYAKAEGEDVNHFDPNYFKHGSWWGLPDLDNSERDYINAKQVFEDDNRIIYDATIGGKLNVFPKISIEKAKQLCKIKS